MIREAQPLDLYEVVDLGWEFNNENKCYSVNSKEDIERSVLKILNDPFSYKMWVGIRDGKIVSNLAVRITEHFFTGDKVVEEVVWFVTKEARTSLESILLIDVAEKFAKEIGAKYFQMANLYTSNIHLDKFIKFFKRRGYEPFQLSYMKKL